MKKKLLSILLAAIMIVGILPTVAFAEPATHDLKVWKDTECTVPATESEDYEWDSNKLIILKDGLTVSGSTTSEYISVGKGNVSVTNLTISNLSINLSTFSGINPFLFNTQNIDATLTLIGNNTITLNSGNQAVANFKGSNTTITGAGSLSASQNDIGTCIYAYPGSLSFAQTGTVTALASGATGIYANSSISFNNGIGKILARSNVKAVRGTAVTLGDALTMKGSTAADAEEDNINGETTIEDSIVKTSGQNALSVLIEGAADSGDCTYTQKVNAPENGKTYGMKLNCKDKGEFTFEASGTGWNIKNSDNKYLNAANGKLVLGDTAATAWTYKNGAFSTSVKTTKKNSGHWFGFIYIPGRGTKTVTTTYYLNRVDAGSLSTCYVCAELYTKVSGVHNYKYVNKCNGTHDKICKNCGENKNEACVYDETTHKCVCGAYKPENVGVKISVVDVKEKTTKQYVGLWPFGRYKEVTTYTATIKTEATGVKVRKVEYQLNGGKNWVTGTSVCSNKAINSLKVRVTDNKGNKYYYEYPEAPAAEFTVTFNMNGHGDPISSITKVTSGATINKPNDPTAEGYVFKGWFKEEACENEWNFESDRVTQDTTLYAKWNITLGGLMASQTNFPADEDNGWAGSSKTSNKLYYAYHEDVQDTLLLVRYEHTWTGPFRTSELTPVANGYEFSFDSGYGYSFTVTFTCDAQNKITSITITGDSNVEDTYAPAAE